MLARVEIAAAAIWLILAFFLPYRSNRGNLRLFRALATHRRLAVAFVGLTGFCASAATAVVIAWPQPKIHDEFSYLLGADTFAHGRLTNPPHPHSALIETFHVNIEPTYCSIYPPGQASFLALGQVVGGHPLVGVWFSFGLACAAVCWMLQAYLPARWAFAGGLIGVVRFGFLGNAGDSLAYWSQSYWGGAVALLGGALVFGGFGRLKRGPRLRDSIALGIGLAILANTRPFEGTVATAPVALAMLLWMLRKNGLSVGIAVVKVVLPIALLLCVTVAWIAFYNSRLTGNPLLLPYQQNGDRYATVPLFLWQPLKVQPAYSHTVIENYHLNWAEPAYERMRSTTGYLVELGKRSRTFANYFLGPVLVVPLLCFPLVLRSQRMRFAALVCASLLGALSVTTWFQPHYAAPIAGLLLLLAVQCLRHLRIWRWNGRPIGRNLIRLLPLIYWVLWSASLIGLAQTDPGEWHQRRASILADLKRTEGRHLIVVKYSPGHSPHHEWVFNEADLNATKVLWVRELTEPLPSWVGDRHVWWLDADSRFPRLIPYQGSWAAGGTRLPARASR